MSTARRRARRGLAPRSGRAAGARTAAALVRAAGLAGAVVLAAGLAGATPAAAEEADDKSTEAAGAEEAEDLGAFEVGGHVEVVYERLQNFDLDDARGDDLDLLPIELELDLLWRPNGFVEAYIQAQLTQWLVLHEEGPNDVPGTEAVIEEAYVLLGAPDAGLALQLGRQSFEDRRQWLYDADLDAVRGSYRAGRLALELSASREALVDQDVLNPYEEESIDNYILHATYEQSGDLAVGGYGVLRDRGGGDATLFLGLFAFGALGERLTWWLDAARVSGEEDGTELRGYGFDLLGAWHLDAPLAPYLILGYAFGSGDSDPDDERDANFRQSGLQGNETEVGGLTPFSYYGETFDPELSNMSILTLGIGARPTPWLSADLVYHWYRQAEAADELREAALDAEPSGRNRELGSELDLVLGFEEEGRFRIRGFLGYFMPGRAFEPGDDALFARIEAQYEF